VQLLTLRAESGLLRTRFEGQEKEIAQLRKQIKHLEEKERVANESVIFYSLLECYKYNMYL
jgi:cell division protein FtsL